MTKREREYAQQENIKNNMGLSYLTKIVMIKCGMNHKSVIIKMQMVIAVRRALNIRSSMTKLAVKINNYFLEFTIFNKAIEIFSDL